MPCLFAVLSVAFPRIAIILLWLFTNFFTGMYQGIIIPALGFLFLPLTLIVYTYLQRAYAGHLGLSQLVFVLIAIVLDLGLVGGGTYGRRRVA
jgi:hypothetical protein